MSKIAIREPVEVEGRHMTPARRARIIARDHGQCVRAGCEVTEGLEVDHIVCLELGGRDADWNCETLCGPHHKQKTKADAGAIARAKRRQANHLGTRPAPKRKLQSRGFAPSRPMSKTSRILPEIIEKAKV
jgi:5-methylcytosine-specific restriction protein A